MRRLRSALILALILVATLPLAAQEGDGPIQDNSFLLEEAYNQEYGVVQHISSFQRLWTSRAWAYTFTQEWPINPAPRHQFSYTIPVVDSGAGAGLGDVLINWRYQLVGSGKTRVALAPRLSLVLPTGSSVQGRGMGGVGVQASLPMSVEAVPRKLVTHWNAGVTAIPTAKSPTGDQARAFAYSLGASAIWLVYPRFNVMLETVWNRSDFVIAPGRTDHAKSLFVSPGVRWAHDFDNGLQIVPGIAVPIGVGPSSGEKGLFLYLSFEHPFRKLK